MDRLVFTVFTLLLETVSLVQRDDYPGQPYWWEYSVTTVRSSGGAQFTEEAAAGIQSRMMPNHSSFMTSWAMNDMCPNVKYTSSGSGNGQWNDEVVNITGKMENQRSSQDHLLPTTWTSTTASSTSSDKSPRKTLFSSPVLASDKDKEMLKRRTKKNIAQRIGGRFSVLRDRNSDGIKTSGGKATRHSVSKNKHSNKIKEMVTNVRHKFKF